MAEQTPNETDRAAEEERYNNITSALVTVLAILMGIFNVKDGNIAQAMSQAQVKAADTWAYYQAKSTKQNIADNQLQSLLLDQVRSTGAAADYLSALHERIATARQEIERYQKEKEALQQQAKDWEKTYEDLNFRDDQFDMAEAGMGIAIAMLGISALTRHRWLLLLAIFFGGFGSLLGFAGFFGWEIHPDILAQWLS
ncbi:MAG: DUF4337 domain-containing protein [Magnetococcales bacterium]|nr:DUF4337 domain-containing protein [Magnetococcales bacterium]